MGDVSRVAAAVAVILLSSCGLGGEPELDEADFDGVPTCGADQFQGLLGQSESVLEGVDLPAASRVLRPDDVIPLDFSPDRLTIDIDDIGRISSVTCR